MEVPLLKAAVQVVPQLMPAGLEVTDPVPANTTESVGRLNVADRVELALIVKVQVGSVPNAEQAPPHPPKIEDAAGVATTVRAVPDG